MLVGLDQGNVEMRPDSVYILKVGSTGFADALDRREESRMTPKFLA